MNIQDYSEALAIAQSKADLTKEDIDIFAGFGLKVFMPVTVTLRQVARLMRWQAGQFNGEWNAAELNAIAHFGRKRFIIAHPERYAA